jgi:hypothetical protein
MLHEVRLEEASGVVDVATAKGKKPLHMGRPRRTWGASDFYGVYVNG